MQNIKNGKVLNLENKDINGVRSSVVTYTLDGDSQEEYKLLLPPAGNPKQYIGKYLQVNLLMIAGKVAEKFTDEPI